MKLIGWDQVTAFTVSLLILIAITGSCSHTPTKEVKTFEVSTPKDYYVNGSTLRWVAETIALANCVTPLAAFHKEILEGEYTHFEGDNSEIVTALTSGVKAKVKTYYKWKGAQAVRTPGTDTIWINRWKVKTGENHLRLKTMIHERLHVLNFKHLGNKKKKYDNINSVPYKVAEIAMRHYEYCSVPRERKLIEDLSEDIN